MRRFAMSVVLVLVLEPYLAGGLSAATIRVPQDQPTIQSALGVAVTGDTILIAAGTYFEQDLDPGGQEVTIRGESGALKTIINAQLGGRIFHVHNSEQAGLLFEGLTFRRGRAPGTENGSAMLISGVASPTIRDCVIEYNEGVSSGIFLEGPSGVTVENSEFLANSTSAVTSFPGDPVAVVIDSCRFAYQPESSVDLRGGSALIRDCVFEFTSFASLQVLDADATITRCVFRQNGSIFGSDTALITLQNGGEVLFDDCEFDDNLGVALKISGQASGTAIVRNSRFVSNLNPSTLPAGIVASNVLLTLEGCDLDGNVSVGGVSGGAALLGGAQGSVMRNCRFRNNMSGSIGGALQAHQFLGVENCLFQKNRAAGSGGAVVSAGSNRAFVHCTFIENEVTHPGALPAGGGIFLNSPNQSMESCIVYGNLPDSIGSTPGSAPSVTYSDVEGGYPGVGNIDADPLFALSTSPESHLTLTSPCVDAGAPGVPSVGPDLDGDDRMIGPAVDMGVDEATLQSLPGTGEGFELHTWIDAAGNPLTEVKTPMAGQMVGITIASPDASFVGSPVVLFGQTTLTGSPLAAPSIPGVDLDPFSPGFLLIFNSATFLPGFGGLVLGPAGFSFDLKTPPGLGGTSLYLQGAALSSGAANGGYAVSNAHEIVLP